MATVRIRLGEIIHIILQESNVCLSVCLFVCLFVCLSVCLSAEANMLITSRTIKPSNLIGQIILSPFLGEGLQLSLH